MRTSHQHLRRFNLLFVLASAMLLLASAFVQPVAAADDTVTVIRLDGTITPVMADFVGRALDDAADRDQVVVIQMNTPGGLSSAMDDIVADILAASVPVIVWVGPNGARAASAGVYITYAAHLATMAPATNIGSATPISLGEDNSEEPESASDRKVLNDAIGKIRGLAELRGRNVEWAEDAVRNAANVSAEQALGLGVIDLIASSIPDLLEQMDGRDVTVAGETRTLHTAGADTRTAKMNWLEQFLQLVSDPNIAFLFVSIGTLALIFELANPGSIGPGAVGVLLLVTGFYSLGTLDASWAALALLAAAGVILAVDLLVVPGTGLLTGAGIATFVVGGLLLSTSDSADVSLLLVFGVGAVLAMLVVLIVGSAWRVRNQAPATGTGTLVGEYAEVRSPLDPQGMVYVQGELWSARAADGATIASGTRVQVTRVDGFVLEVREVRLPDAATSGNATASDVHTREAVPGAEAGAPVWP